jgi:hypothetical protein
VTSNAERAAALEAALRAGLARDHDALRAALTDDVRIWTPTLSTSSLDELLDELEDRDEAFTDLDVTIVPLDVGGDHACVEWTVEMTHAGPFPAPDGTSLVPAGTRIAVHGATVAEFVGDRICALRQYWDEMTVVDQLVLESDDEE